MPMASYSLSAKLRKPDLFLLPSELKAHLENHFPAFIIFHGGTALGKVAQYHFFIPEAENLTRTYVLLFAQPKNPIFKLFGNTFLNFAKVVVDQDAAILNQIYPNSPQKIKLNNEVGMDWVKRNFESFPNVVKPNLSS
jgi:hypothetical protein